MQYIHFNDINCVKNIPLIFSIYSLLRYALILSVVDGNDQKKNQNMSHEADSYANMAKCAAKVKRRV